MRALNPVTLVRERQRDTLREDLHVNMEAEAGVMQPREGNASSCQKLEEARNGFSLELCGCGPANTLILTQ